MMFIAGTGIAGTFHKTFSFYIIFSQAVDHDVDVDVATIIASICMSAD